MSGLDKNLGKRSDFGGVIAVIQRFIDLINCPEHGSTPTSYNPRLSGEWSLCGRERCCCADKHRFFWIRPGDVFA